MSFVPAVDPAIWAIAPGFRALSITASRNADAASDPDAGARALGDAISVVQAGGPSWADAHLAAWGEVFRSFGAKPQRTPCSAQSLRERVVKSGTLGSIDPVVDLYNAVSLKFAVPAGGENAEAYRGIPRLVVADGNEAFDTMKNGAPATESPERGEVIWRDEVGATCRRWNWRQGVRTRIDASVTGMWFVLESLPEMPMEALEEAGAALVSGLTALFGEVATRTVLLKQE